MEKKQPQWCIVGFAPYRAASHIMCKYVWCITLETGRRCSRRINHHRKCVLGISNRFEDRWRQTGLIILKVLHKAWNCAINIQTSENKICSLYNIYFLIFLINIYLQSTWSCCPNYINLKSYMSLENNMTYIYIYIYIVYYYYYKLKRNLKYIVILISNNFCPRIFVNLFLKITW